MSQQIEQRLAALEDKVLKLELAAEMANHREQALMRVLSWLLAYCPDQNAPSYLIDWLEEQEALAATPERLELVAVYEHLIEFVGLWLDVRSKSSPSQRVDGQS